MRLNRKNSRENFALDLTTCSDIIFTLLIFYILTQSFVTSVPANLPALKSDFQSINQNARKFEILENGRIQLENSLLPESWENEISRIISAATATDTTWLILAHDKAPAKTAIELLDRLRLAGVTNVSFGGMPKKDEQ
jgi:biopolymer transport protein ExbD